MLPFGLFLEVALAVVGVRAVLQRRLPVGRARAVVGRPAVILGLVALTPVPLAALAGLVYALNEDPVRPRTFAQAAGTLNLVEFLIALGAGALVFGTGALISGRTGTPDLSNGPGPPDEHNPHDSNK